MQDVYTYAVVTLSSASSSAHDGLFSTRPRGYVVPLQIASLPNAHALTTVTLHPPLIETERIEQDAQVTTRAWCFQEKELSNRFVQFTSHQWIWACHGRTASEDEFFDPLHTRITTGAKKSTSLLGSWTRHSQVHIQLTSPYFDDEDEHTRRTSLRTILMNWYRCVVAFTSRDITHPHDRLVAMHGIAMRHRAVLPEPFKAYIAGLWEADLRRGLLWYAPSPAPRLTEKRLGPTWSWAGLNAAVSYDQAVTDDGEAKCVPLLCPHLEVLHNSGASRTDRSLYLMVTGWLFEAWVSKHDPKTILPSSPRELEDLELMAMWDWEDDARDSDEPLFCLPLVTAVREWDDAETFPIGLILRRTAQAEQLYQRIGLFYRNADQMFKFGNVNEHWKRVLQSDSWGKAQDFGIA